MKDGQSPSEKFCRTAIIKNGIMTKVEKVSIGGIAFVLDEEAYGILDSYLGELRDYYGDRDGGGEIMDDIEERLAELITEKSRGSEVRKQAAGAKGGFTGTRTTRFSAECCPG